MTTPTVVRTGSINLSTHLDVFQSATKVDQNPSKYQNEIPKPFCYATNPPKSYIPLAVIRLQNLQGNLKEFVGNGIGARENEEDRS